MKRVLRWGLVILSVVVGCGRIDFDTELDRPRTCRDLKRRGLPTGVANLDPDGDGPAPARDVWCEQAIRDGGWTLALKIDGAQATFEGSSNLWEDMNLLNPSSLDPAALDEAKLAPYLDEPLAEILVITEGGGDVVLRARGASLHHLIASGLILPSASPEAEWTTTFPPGLLEPGCRRQGVGLTNRPTAGSPYTVRIGLAASLQTDDCEAASSFLGVGIEGACSTAKVISAGNINRGGTVGDTCTPQRVAVYVRGDDETHEPSRPSCADHLALGRTDDGIYLVNGSARRCDMTTAGGGWTNAIDLDSTSDACPPPWIPDPSGVPVCIAAIGETASGLTVPSPIASYREVMVSVIGLQRASTDAFFGTGLLDDVYMDGLSITSGKPRQHVASFAAGYHDLMPCDEATPGSCQCPCAGGKPRPAFVAPDALRCEAGARASPQNHELQRPDPLYDGAEFSTGCAAESSAEPIRTLLADGTAADLEARLMRNEPAQGEGLAVYRMSIWVR